LQEGKKEWNINDPRPEVALFIKVLQLIDIDAV